MAATNRTRDDMNFQKKGVCVAVAPFVESEILGDGSVFFVMPERAVITKVSFNFTTVSTTATPDISVTCNGTAVVTDVDCGSVSGVGVIQTNALKTGSYFATGGDLVVKAGSTAPAAGNLVGEVIVEYIELDKNTGEYTDITG